MTKSPNFRYFNRISINSILFSLTQSLVPNWPIHTYHKHYHINAHLYFHYPNRHDLPNWTFVYSTIEIGHRTLDPPASNRKSVLIPIILKEKSTLLIIRKCRHDAVYELFFCAFKDRNTLNMRSLPCFNHTSLINANILRFVATIGHEFLL